MAHKKTRTLINSYSVYKRIQILGEVGFSKPDIGAEDTESEWKLFRRVIFVRYKDSILQGGLSRLIYSDNSDIATAFPNLRKVAAIVNVLRRSRCFFQTTSSHCTLMAECSVV